MRIMKKRGDAYVFLNDSYDSYVPGYRIDYGSESDHYSSVKSSEQYSTEITEICDSIDGIFCSTMIKENGNYKEDEDNTDYKYYSPDEKEISKYKENLRVNIDKRATIEKHDPHYLKNKEKVDKSCQTATETLRSPSVQNYDDSNGYQIPFGSLKTLTTESNNNIAEKCQVGIGCNKNNIFLQNIVVDKRNVNRQSKSGFKYISCFK